MSLETHPGGNSSNPIDDKTRIVNETVLPIDERGCKSATIKIAFAVKIIFPDEKSAKGDNYVRPEAKRSELLDMIKEKAKTRQPNNKKHLKTRHGELPMHSKHF